MAFKKTPGVYIEEISTLPASIAAVPTAVPAFIGYTEKADNDGNDLTDIPTRITSMLEFKELFGGPNPEIFDIEIEDTYGAGDVLLTREISAKLPTLSGFNLYYSLQMFFNNGGGSCYIVSVGNYSLGTFDEAKFKTGIDKLEVVDEPTLVVFPDAVNLYAPGATSPSTPVTEYGEVVAHGLAHCEKLQDRFIIADCLQIESENDKSNFWRTAIGNNNLKYGAAYFPFLNSSLNYGFYYDDALQKVSHTQTGGTPLIPPPVFDDMTLKKVDEDTPTIYRQILAEIKKHYVTLPPSGAIAGIYARVDADRGVWKAPANVSLNSVIGPAIKLTNADQDLLNIDASTGKSINAIRTFAGKGTLVWGARTLAGNDNEWKYVPVRRLYIFVEESIKKATEFVVFEPNDRNTWVRVKSMIENFLTALWREGALAGAKPEDAFFVKVGLGETMIAEDILNGYMNVEIGMAAVRPAEFIILKFSHKLQES